jgi:hypothetical protein
MPTRAAVFRVLIGVPFSTRRHTSADVAKATTVKVVAQTTKEAPSSSPVGR